jgi:hypothetical protein
MAPPRQPRRPQPVTKESPASGPLHHLQSELLAAKSAWEQLGVRIAKGYTLAYAEHVNTLTLMKKAKEAEMSNNALMFVLSVVSVGFAGGLVGGLIAPFIQNVGARIAGRVWSSAVAGATQDTAKGLVKIGAQVIDDARKGEGDPYRAVSPKDLLVDQEIRDRIASAFGPILEALDAMIDEANTVQADASAGQTILNNFRQNCPLLTDKPAQADIPSERDAWRAAELAMWVAWANERDWSWWNKQYEVLDPMARHYYGRKERWYDDRPHGLLDAKKYVLELDPVGNRLAAMGKRWQVSDSVLFYPIPLRGTTDEELRQPNAFTTSTENGHQRDSFLYIDLRKLRALRIDDVDLPFRKLSGLSFGWDRTSPLGQALFLSKTQDVKPAYK